MTEASNTPGRNQTALWVIITIVGQGWRLAGTVVAAVILARLLKPSDFGLIATIAPIIGFVDMIRDAGFSQALIQRKEVTDRQANALFWLLMAITFVLFSVLVLLSPVIGAFFGDGRLTGALVVSAVGMIIVSFASQPLAWMNRRLEFKEIALIDSVQVTVSLIVSVAIAFLTKSYWAIIAGNICAALSTAFLACASTGWRPGRPEFDRTVWQMARFGATISFSNVLNFLSRNTDNLLIAKVYGSGPVGLYDRAYKLMLMPLSQITWPISRVLTPVLSRSLGNEAQYARLYISTITAIMVALQPGVIVATVFSGPVVKILLGDDWSGAAPIFAWLGLAAVHQLVTSSHGWLYLSQGRARDYTIVGVFGSVTTVLAFFVGLRWGAVGVAAAYTITDYVLRLPFAWLFVGRDGPVRTRALLRAVFPHVLSALLTAGLMVSLKVLAEPPGLFGLMFNALISYVTYIGSLACFSDKRAFLREYAIKIFHMGRKAFHLG